MKNLDVNQEQLQKIKSHPGFIAALDQSGGSTPKALSFYGIKENAWSNEDEMFAIVHQMRARMITSPSFNGDRIIAAILFGIPWTRASTANLRLLSLEHETCGPVPKSRPGPCRREGRRPTDEANTRACRAARES